MGFRPTPGLREKLESAARANSRSMSQEVEERLGQSFKEDENLGSMGLRALLLLFRSAAALVEQRTGKSCFDDWNTWLAVQGAWKHIGADFGPLPPKKWREAKKEANKALTGVLLEPYPEDAEIGAQAAHLIEAVKGLQAVRAFHSHERDDRTQEAIGEEVVSLLYAEEAKLPPKTSKKKA